MTMQVPEEYPELLHYTTAEGLQGIISSQTLRATHHGYVNDIGEFKDFFESRLPIILKSCVGKALAELYSKNSEINKLIDSRGGVDKLTTYLEVEIYKYLKGFSHSTFEAYLISFCGVKTLNKEKDGLLSQWRAYGVDGGYAVVFDSKPISDYMLNKEFDEYRHIVISFGAVDYHEPDNSNLIKKPLSSDFDKHVDNLKEAIARFVLSEESKDAKTNLIIESILLAGLHKHASFCEEQEIRIVSIKSRPELNRAPSKKKISEISFNIRNGLLVPYITLFRNQTLPIKRVIVGPHPDRIRRKESVEKLLYQQGLNLEVVISDIPYIGKF